MTTDGAGDRQPTGSGEPGRPSGSGKQGRLRLLPVLVGAWAVVLLIVAYVSVRHDPPTVREQRSLADVLPVVDRAVGALVAAGGPDAFPELGEPRLDTGCRLSVVRSGTSLTRSVTFHSEPGEAAALLDRISAGLPAGYRSGTRIGFEAAEPRLRADAGEFVGITGGVTAPGRIDLTVSTGCRPDSPHPAASGPPEQPRVGSALRDQVARTLGALGLPAPDPAATFPTASHPAVTDHATPAPAALNDVTATCPNGGVAETVRARVPGTPAGDLAARLRPLVTAGAVALGTPDSYGYRAGPLSVLVRTVDGETRASATHPC